MKATGTIVLSVISLSVALVSVAITVAIAATPPRFTAPRTTREGRARVVKVPIEPSPSASSSVVTSTPAPPLPPSLFPTLDSPQPNATALLADARRIAALGVPIDIQTRVLDIDDYRRALAITDDLETMSLARGRSMPSMRIVHVPIGSLYDRAGFRDGDIVMSTNGNGYPAPNTLVPTLWGTRHATLTEVMRDGRRVVLYVTSPESNVATVLSHR